MKDLCCIDRVAALKDAVGSVAKSKNVFPSCAAVVIPLIDVSLKQTLSGVNKKDGQIRIKGVVLPN